MRALVLAVVVAVMGSPAAAQRRRIVVLPVEGPAVHADRELAARWTSAFVGALRRSGVDVHRHTSSLAELERRAGCALSGVACRRKLATMLSADEVLVSVMSPALKDQVVVARVVRWTATGELSYADLPVGDGSPATEAKRWARAVRARP